MEIQILAPGDPLWDAVADYAGRCSWGAGPVLADQMRNGAFSGWERVLAAVDGEKIAGFCTFSRRDCLPDAPYTPYAGFVFVGEEYRGKRLSGRLIEAAGRLAVQAGFRRIYLVSDHRGLYERYGFRPVGQYPAPWAPGTMETLFARDLVSPLKNLIFIGGTMGVGKTTVSRELQKLLPDCVFLDGDWCWDMRPFVVNEETKGMVTDNIIHLLGNFLRCSAYRNVIFCWVMHQQEIIDGLLQALSGEEFRFFGFSLVCGEEALRRRLEKDVRAGVREPDVIERSIVRLPLYEKLSAKIIDTGEVSAFQAAQKIAGIIREGEGWFPEAPDPNK